MFSVQALQALSSGCFRLVPSKSVEAGLLVPSPRFPLPHRPAYSRQPSGPGDRAQRDEPSRVGSADGPPFVGGWELAVGCCCFMPWVKRWFSPHVLRAHAKFSISRKPSAHSILRSGCAGVA